MAVDPDDVAAALDALLGEAPVALVEERPEPRNPDDLDEALAHLYRSPASFWQLG